MTKVEQEQRELCAKYGLAWVSTPGHVKVGLARNVGSGIHPLNGLRHPLTDDTSGWYIWAGDELSREPDFFEPVHASHLAEICPDVLRFLGLPPGSRFLTAGDYIDVWEDRALLTV